MTEARGAVAIAALALVLTACTQSSTVDPTETTGEPGLPGQSAVVTQVTDGDTVWVDFGGDNLEVRLIGINTPETVHPTEPVGCYGHAASRFTTEELEGESVRLEFDVERLDQYERTLAYIWLEGDLFNEVLVARGFAQVDTFPPNVKYKDRFIAAQRDAWTHERGLWGATCNEPAPLGIAGGGGGGGDCDPSYPDVCIPPYPPDLDCDDAERLGYSNFEVKPPDPHGFDEVSDDDPDVIGCES